MSTVLQKRLALVVLRESCVNRRPPAAVKNLQNFFLKSLHLRFYMEHDLITKCQNQKKKKKKSGQVENPGCRRY